MSGVDREWTVLIDGEQVLTPGPRERAEGWMVWAREQVEDPEPGIERAVLAYRPVAPWVEVQ